MTDQLEQVQTEEVKTIKKIKEPENILKGGS